MVQCGTVVMTMCIFVDIVHAAGIDVTYGTNVDDDCFDDHDYGDDTDHDTDDKLMMIQMVILMMRLLMILIVDAGTCIQSRFKAQGPCPGSNEHPRRAIDVALSQSKAPIGIFKSR